MKPRPFATLMQIIRDLKAAQIYFELAYHRYDAVSINATVPGERWEIDVLEDGSVDFERFVTDGGVVDGSVLPKQIAKWAEVAAEEPA